MFIRFSVIAVLCSVLFPVGDVRGADTDSQDESTNATATQPAPRVHPFHGPKSVLPTGSLTVDVMQLGSPPRLAELGGRLQEAARQDPEWWVEFARRGRPGQPPPYDERTGLTQEEYKEFLELNDQVALVKAAEAELHVAETEPGVYELYGGEKLPELNGVAIDLNQDEVRTLFGTAGQRSDIKANDGQRATGRWNGVEWRLHSPGMDEDTGLLIVFALGRLTESGKAILLYKVRDPIAGQSLTRVLSYEVVRD